MTLHSALFLIAAFFLGGSFTVLQAEVYSPQDTTDFELPHHKVIIKAPISYISDNSIISITVDGKKTYKFLLDTGSGWNFITSKASKELGLERIEDNIHIFTTPSEIIKLEQQKFFLKEAFIENIKIKNLYFHSIVNFDTSDGIFSKLGVDGILGIKTFQNILLTINYAQEKIILSRGSLNENDKWVVPLSKKSNMPFIHAEIPLLKRHKIFKEWLLLDTGYFGFVFINTCKFPELNKIQEISRIRRLDMFGHEDIQHFAQLMGSIKIKNDIVLENPYITFAKFNCGKITSGLLGSAFFKKNIITFDQKKHLVRIEPIGTKIFKHH